MSVSLRFRRSGRTRGIVQIFEEHFRDCTITNLFLKRVVPFAVCTALFRRIQINPLYVNIFPFAGTSYVALGLAAPPQHCIGGLCTTLRRLEYFLGKKCLKEFYIWIRGGRNYKALYEEIVFTFDYNSGPDLFDKEKDKYLGAPFFKRINLIPNDHRHDERAIQLRFGFRFASEPPEEIRRTRFSIIDWYKYIVLIGDIDNHGRDFKDFMRMSQDGQSRRPAQPTRDAQGAKGSRSTTTTEGHSQTSSSNTTNSPVRRPSDGGYHVPDYEHFVMLLVTSPLPPQVAQVVQSVRKGRMFRKHVRHTSAPIVLAESTRLRKKTESPDSDDEEIDVINVNEETPGLTREGMIFKGHAVHNIPIGPIETTSSSSPCDGEYPTTDDVEIDVVNVDSPVVAEESQEALEVEEGIDFTHNEEYNVTTAAKETTDSSSLQTKCLDCHVSDSDVVDKIDVQGSPCVPPLRDFVELAEESQGEDNIASSSQPSKEECYASDHEDVMLDVQQDPCGSTMEDPSDMQITQSNDLAEDKECHITISHIKAVEISNTPEPSIKPAKEVKTVRKPEEGENLIANQVQIVQTSRTQKLDSSVVSTSGEYQILDYEDILNVQLDPFDPPIVGGKATIDSSPTKPCRGMFPVPDFEDLDKILHVETPEPSKPGCSKFSVDYYEDLVQILDLKRTAEPMLEDVCDLQGVQKSGEEKIVSEIEKINVPSSPVDITGSSSTKSESAEVKICDELTQILDLSVPERATEIEKEDKKSSEPKVITEFIEYGFPCSPIVTPDASSPKKTCAELMIYDELLELLNATEMQVMPASKKETDTEIVEDHVQEAVELLEGNITTETSDSALPVGEDNVNLTQDPQEGDLVEMLSRGTPEHITESQEVPESKKTDTEIVEDEVTVESQEDIIIETEVYSIPSSPIDPTDLSTTKPGCSEFKTYEDLVKTLILGSPDSPVDEDTETEVVQISQDEKVVTENREDNTPTSPIKTTDSPPKKSSPRKFTTYEDLVATLNISSPENEIDIQQWQTRMVQESPEVEITTEGEVVPSSPSEAPSYLEYATESHGTLEAIEENRTENEEALNFPTRKRNRTEGLITNNDKDAPIDVDLEPPLKQPRPPCPNERCLAGICETCTPSQPELSLSDFDFE